MEDDVATVAIVSASSLPVNLFASSVLAIAFGSAAAAAAAATKVNPNEIKCEICDEGEEDATSFCVQCAQYLCGGCERAHKKQRGTAGHEFVLVATALKENMKVSVAHCERHPQFELNTYCHKERQAICSECSVDRYKGHKIDRLVNVAQGFKEDISQLVDKVSCFLAFLLSCSSSIPNLIIFLL